MNIISVSDINKHVLLNLMQAYEAEFSAITQKVPDSEGVFELDTVLDEFHDGYLLYVDDSPVGFAIKGVEGRRHDVSEFYVIPSKRGKNIGCDFACQLFAMYTGEWQVRQIKGAEKAKAFWRKVISQYTGNNYEESEVDDKYWGRVTRQVFSVPFGDG